MQIKRYTGETMKKALAAVRAELGPEAVLLKSRTLSPREATQGKKIEVCAAVNPAGSAFGSDDLALDSHLALGLIQEDLARIRATLVTASAKESISPLIKANSQLRLFLERLLSAGVEESLALELVNQLLERLSPRPTAETIQKELSTLLREVLTVAGPRSEGPIRWALVGPTGVGKTTTLAKLAAHFIQQGRSVGLITVDTYRLAATEQLSAYARLMGLELTVAFNRRELLAALHFHRDKDVVLIDTAGRNHNHLLNMNETKMLLREVEGLERWLVLSATTKDRDLTGATRRFLEIGLSGLIFTKLDETDSYGGLLNQVLRFGLPVAYLTAGQRVPEDLESASQERLLRLVLNGADQTQGVSQ
ncbi:MAG: AAA family ATPase [Deltaproteobacteria bacterium]|nr:AAA family ATPase [Deltaproteobacteria bacterium]